MAISSIIPEGRFYFTNGKRRTRSLDDRAHSKRIKREEDIPPLHVQRKRIYEAVFSDPRTNRNAAALKEALRTFSPDVEGSEEPAIDLLTKWNKGVPAPFNLDDLAALRSLFVEPPMMRPRRMAPVQPDPALAMQALRFWNKLVAGDKPAVQTLWDLLHKFDTEASPRHKRALVDHLDTMVPGVTWTDEHLSSLVAIAVHEVDFQCLAWFEASGDMW